VGKVNKYKLLCSIGALLLVSVLFLDYFRFIVSVELLFSLLVLAVISLIVSMHGLLKKYLLASVAGTASCTVPLAIYVLINPGMFGIAAVIEGFLIFVGIVFVVSLAIGLIMVKSQGTEHTNGI